mgnify:CR=1 FL=1
MIVITEKEVYSDAGKLVHRIGTESYFTRCIKLSDDADTDFEEVDEIPVHEEEEAVPFEEQAKIVLKAQTRQVTTFSNNEALKVRGLFDYWSDFIGQTLNAGQIVRTAEGLWRVRQEHVAQAHYAPSIHTAALYERIVRDHEGTESDPIPYAPPMEIFNGKYYTQDGVKYYCNRDSEQALTHNLSELVGLYVSIVE